ncbi:xaa-pro dipeptidase [Ophiostoma piceae UAMH 11346]|uniref:Xaa-pro dipeptidase n=1 Tax=Ophiostoma piceae (strain UAMH 11346) TaxID=1262450 RepID=S3BSB6_OPHP1|nr:xaa-pro dipeptidase [Ophiostoma piceae UAMH 11346]
MSKGVYLSETSALLAQPAQPVPARPCNGLAATKRKAAWMLAGALSLAAWHYGFALPEISKSHASVVDKVQQCANTNLRNDNGFLDSAVPIAPEEFLERRDRLANALVQSGVDAFVLEPGYTFQYYGNISQVDWEPWEPEERPFLMVVMPQIDDSGKVTAKTAFLSPHFEEGRVRMLGMPSREEELDIVIWEEHWNPYDTFIKSRLFEDKQGKTIKVMVDEEIRDYIVRGLDAAGFETLGLSPEVELVRQIKSPAEVELLRAVNTGTVVAVRAMRPCLVPGLTEDEVTTILNNALLSVNFSLFFNIVLFEEHGALPHGGFVTGWKKLTHETMIVIDVGAHYLGYSSDICRSFFIDPPKSKSSLLDRVIGLFGSSKMADSDSTAASKELYEEKLKIWDIVLEAQAAAAAAFLPNNSAASVDIAARTVIENAGYGNKFTHRLGHGIGIKAHESPYLNKWNTEVILQPGMTFADEPGIYLENRFGIRHEDIYLVKESGHAELLSGPLAQGPYAP